MGPILWLAFVKDTKSGSLKVGESAISVSRIGETTLEGLQSKLDGYLKAGFEQASLAEYDAQEEPVLPSVSAPEVSPAVSPEVSPEVETPAEDAKETSETASESAPQASTDPASV